jgi:predicted nucleotidyltransferase
VSRVKLKDVQRSILPVLKKHDVVRAGLFGSIVRGETKRGSDIDILIEFKGEKSLLDLAGLEIALEKTLKKKVDVLTYDSVHSFLRERILREEVRIL